eukprot:4450364-Prymnesium_polylepis.1
MRSQFSSIPSFAFWCGEGKWVTPPVGSFLESLVDQLSGVVGLRTRVEPPPSGQPPGARTKAGAYY